MVLEIVVLLFNNALFSFCPVLPLVLALVHARRLNLLVECPPLFLTGAPHCCPSLPGVGVFRECRYQHDPVQV